VLKAILHALSSSKHSDAPFLAVLVLPVWDDTPWTFAAIIGHPNMSTLIRIPKGHMRFVPANKQTDQPSMKLKPAEWPVELVLIANALGRETYLDNGRIQTILSPTIQAICCLKPEEITFFPLPLPTRLNSPFRTPSCPTRPIPTRPAIVALMFQMGPSTPHQGMRPDTSS